MNITRFFTRRSLFQGEANGRFMSACADSNWHNAYSIWRWVTISIQGAS